MEIGRIIVQDQLGKKFQRLQLNQKLGVGICLSSQLHRKQRSEDGSLSLAPGKKCETLPKK
jgi:hypothetical protein